MLVLEVGVTRAGSAEQVFAAGTCSDWSVLRFKILPGSSSVTLVKIERHRPTDPTHPRTFSCEGTKLCMQKGLLAELFTIVRTHTHTIRQTHAHTHTPRHMLTCSNWFVHSATETVPTPRLGTLTHTAHRCLLTHTHTHAVTRTCTHIRTFPRLLKALLSLAHTFLRTKSLIYICTRWSPRHAPPATPPGTHTTRPSCSRPQGASRSSAVF